MSEPIFGISITRIDEEPRPAIGSDLSIIGLVGSATGADASVYPLNTPVRIFSDDSAMTTKLGTGRLADAVNMINDQLGEFQVAAQVVVVRVAAGLNMSEDMTNVIGNQDAKTGMWALMKSGEDLGIIPRIILTPGVTETFTEGTGDPEVTSAEKSGGNTGEGTLTLADPAFDADDVQNGVYVIRCIGGARDASSAPKVGGNTGDGTMGSLTADATAEVGDWRVICTDAETDGGTFTVLRPDGSVDGFAVVGAAYNSAAGLNFTIADGLADFVVGDEFVVTVTAVVPANGGVFSVTDPLGNALANATEGVAYDGEIKFQIDDVGADFVIGDGFDVTVASAGDSIANPVVVELASLLPKLLGHAIVTGPNDELTTFISWRETIQSDRIIPIASKAKVGVNAVVKDAAPAIAGIAVRRDHEKGGLPFWSWANQPVQGIVAPDKTIPFVLTDGAVEGQQYLAANGGIIARGQMGVEAAIASGGFVFVGTDNCAEDDLWRFYNVTRGRDYIHLMFLRTLRFYLGRFNITGHTITAILNTMKIALRDLKAQEAILGYRVGFTRDLNSPENIRLGKFTVSFAAEEAPVLRHLGIQSARYRPAFEALLSDLEAQLSQFDVAA